MDDGADLVSSLIFMALRRLDGVHAEVRAFAESIGDAGCTRLLEGVLGSTEETTTGVIRLRAMERDGVLPFPVIAVNDAATKHLFDNRYGTGQSTIDGILRATNVLISGHDGGGRRVRLVRTRRRDARPRARRARDHGTEVDPVRALEAVMDGFSVMPLVEAAPLGDVFVTVTGDRDVITAEHALSLKDGAILCNSGHFDVEIDVAGLRELATERWIARPFVEALRLPNGRTVHVLAEGRLVNLAAAEGHPAAVMDMSFANQALCAEHLVHAGHMLDNRVHPVPEAIDHTIARLKLETMGVGIDTLTAAQEAYLASWEEGT